MNTWKQKNGKTATYIKLIRIFKQAGYQEYADYVKMIGQASSSDSSYSGLEDVKQPPTYPKQKMQSLSHRRPATLKSTAAETYMIIEEGLPEGKGKLNYRTLTKIWPLQK